MIATMEPVLSAEEEVVDRPVTSAKLVPPWLPFHCPQKYGMLPPVGSARGNPPVCHSATAAAAIAGNNRCAFAHSKDGKPYRSFRLVSVNHKQWTADGVQHTALNKSKTVCCP